MTYSLHVSHVDLKDKSPLAWHVLIKLIWLSMVSMFLPAILRYEYGLTLSQIFLFEAAYSAVILIITYFFSLQFTARYGTIASMMLWVVVFCANFVVLYFAKTIPRLLFFSPVLSWFYVAYFRIGYHVAMSLQPKGTSAHIGTANSFIESVWIVAGLIGPLLWWLLADYFWSNMLYVVTVICLLISCFPFFFHQRRHVPIVFHPHQSITRTTRNIPFLKAVMISFASMWYVYFVWSVIWTLILYKFLWTYTKLAFVSVVSSLVLLIAFKYLGRVHDSGEWVKKANIARLLKRSFRSQSGTWLFASVLLFSGLLTQLFFICIDTIHKIAYRVNELSLMNYFYEEAWWTHMSKVLDTIFVREISIHGSRILFCSLLAGITYMFKGQEDWWLILSLFFVFLIAPFGGQLLIWKQQHVAEEQQKKSQISSL